MSQKLLSRPGRGRSVLPLAIALLLAMATVGGASAAPEAAVRRVGDRVLVPTGSPLRERLAVESVGMQAAPRFISVPAIVEADPARVVVVSPPLSGRLVRLMVGLGERVHVGQALAQIASPDLDQAKSDVAKARDSLDLATASLARAREVFEIGAGARKDFEAARSAQAQARADDQRARARLATLTGSRRVDMSPLLSVISPISGTVTTLNVGSGTYLNDATAPLMTIAALDRVWVTAQLPENQLGAVAVGDAVDVALAAYPGGEPLHGRVAMVSPVIEPDTRRAKVRIAFANGNGRLKPNMFATARFAVRQSDRVVVPTSALLMNNDDTTVFVEVAPWTFVRRAVEVGSEERDSAQVVSGLRPGDRIVIRGGVLLND